jgi:hypothetical protein
MTIFIKDLLEGILWIWMPQKSLFTVLKGPCDERIYNSYWKRDFARSLIVASGGLTAGVDP